MLFATWSPRDSPIVAVGDGIDGRRCHRPSYARLRPPLIITDGHADINLLPCEYHWIVTEFADGLLGRLATKVREASKYGADVSRSWPRAASLEGDHPARAYSWKSWAALTAEAAQAGRRVQRTRTACNHQGCAPAGIGSVEHAILIDDEGIALSKRLRPLPRRFERLQRIFHTRPRYKQVLFRVRLKRKATRQSSTRDFRRAYLAGFKIAYGTDRASLTRTAITPGIRTYGRMGHESPRSHSVRTFKSADLIGGRTRWSRRTRAIRRSDRGRGRSHAMIVRLLEAREIPYSRGGKVISERPCDAVDRDRRALLGVLAAHV